MEIPCSAMTSTTPKLIVTNEAGSDDAAYSTQRPSPDQVRPLGIGRWLAMMRSSEYAQLIPGSEIITECELSKHNNIDDMWMALPHSGKLCVFDVTKFAQYHPGGIDLLLQHSATDASEAYRMAHSYVNVDIIGKFRKGFLQRRKPGTPSFRNLLSFNVSSLPTRMESMKPNWNWSHMDGQTTELAVYYPSFRPLLGELSWVDSLRVLARWFPPADPLASDARGLLLIRTLLHGVYHKIIFRLLPSLLPDLPSLHLSCNRSALESRTAISSTSSVRISSLLNLHDKTPPSSTTGEPLKTLGSVIVDALVSVNSEPDLDVEDSFVECTVVENSLMKDSNYHLIRICWPSDSVWMPVPLGHHLIVRVRHQDGHWLSRPYTPVCDNFDFTLYSETMFSSYATTLTLMVKLYPDGQLSPLIQRLHCGDSIQVSFPIGQTPPNFLRPPVPISISPTKASSPFHHPSVFMLAGGSGITVMLRPINWLLCNQRAVNDFRSTVHMIWFNRTIDAVPLKQELDDLCRRFPTRFSLMHVLSEQSAEALPRGYTFGSISEQICHSGLLTLHLSGMDPCVCRDSAIWLICGPLGFNNAAVRVAKQWGAPEDHIFEFKG